MNVAERIEDARGGAAARDVTCRIDEWGGWVQATVTDPGTARTAERLELAKLADVDHVAANHRAAVRSSVEQESPEVLASATERMLTEVYELIAAPLLDPLEASPRVALDIRSQAVASLPVETAHRSTEPALFEVTQLYRKISPAGRSRRPGRERPRRFRLSLHPGALTSLDVIALEQSLIHWVSANTGRKGTDVEPEPLVHIAGHDPIVPEGLLDLTDRAHVVLSGCSSLPSRLPPGVSSAVGSLWPVDDQSNSSIMAAYHARLAAGIGPVEALRQAQLLHRHLPPAAWAAYVHVGQPV